MSKQDIKKVTVCICISTRNRINGLNRILNSLEELVIDKSIIKNVYIVIVENNDKPIMYDLVQNHPLNDNIELKYLLENKIGIIYSRNKAVEYSIQFDYSLFIDDDQTVEPNLLHELMKCLIEFNADAIYGNNPPIYENGKKYPRYVMRYFNRFNNGHYGEQIEDAPTNCLLINNNWLNKIHGPFDLRFNFTGGSDIYLTKQLTSMGMKLIRNPYAIAYEHIPESRCNISYILKRTYSSANSRTMVYMYLPEPTSKLLKRLILLSVKFILGLIMAIPIFLFYPNNRIYGLQKIAESSGGLFVILGFKHNIYKKGE